MATQTVLENTDVPRTGGYTRFELELEVRPLLPPYYGDVICPWLVSINPPLVRAVSCESCLS